MASGQLPRHVEALLSPSAYPHPVERAELIQTHISYVLLAGAGEIVEHAIKMKRLPQERMMERLLAENAVSSEMLTELTGRLAAFHGSSESSKHISTFGSRETVGSNWQENFGQTD